MTLRFLSPQTAAMARDVSLLGLLSESIDANADTVCLITGDQRTELEWLVHYDYHRALQRLGHETLARHDQRVPGSRPWGRGRGAAVRAVRLLSSWAFAELRLARLGLYTTTHNHRQLRLPTPA